MLPIPLITLSYVVITNLAFAAPVVELGVCSEFSDYSAVREALHYAAKVALKEGFFDDVLKNTSFDVNIRTVDSGCSATDASQVALPLLLGQGSTNGRIYSDTVDTPPVVAVAGCYCSGATVVVSQLAAPLEVVVVSGTASAPTLSNKALHPYFARTVPPDSAQGAGLARLVRTFAQQAPSNSWNEIVLMYPQDTYSEGIADAFSAAEAVSNFSIIKAPLALLSTRTVELTVDFEYDKLVATAERVLTQTPMARIFVYPSPGDLYPAPIVRAFKEVGLFNNESVVFTSESMLVSFYDEIDRMVESQEAFYEASIGSSSEEYWSASSFDWSSLDETILGWLGMVPEGDGERSHSAEWETFWTGLTPEKLLAAGMPSDSPLEASWFSDLSEFKSNQWNSFFFDGVSTILAGISDLLAAGTPASGLRGEALLEAVYAVEFEGLTGNIVLDENGDRLGSYRIMNYQANRTLVDIGQYDASSDSVALDESPIWPSGSTEVPWGRPQPCDPGYEYTDGKCQACPVGQFASTADSTCVDCPAGSFTISTGTSICSSAPLGMYVSTSGSSEATLCEVGHFSDELGAVTCDSCAPGFYASKIGFTECSYCEAGTFTESAGSSVCGLCPSGQTTSGVASREASDCVCEAGSYALSSTAVDPLSMTCLSCPGGMTCPLGSSDNTSSDVRPIPNAGYMTLPSDALKAYKCLSDDYCPGGSTGVCGSHRDPNSIACGLCASGSFSNGSECTPCSGGIVDVLFFAGLTVLAVIAVIVVAIVASRGALTQSENSVMVGVSAGLLLTGVQTLNVFDQLSISWFEPVAFFMSVLRLLNFNLSALRTECIWGSDAALGYIARQLVAPLSIPVILLTVSVKFRFTDFRGKILPSTANATGVICHIFFISLIVSTSGPFICYKHPDDSSSMRSSPSTLCFQASDHTIMTVAAGVSFLLIPIPFMAAAAYGTLNYQKLLRSATSGVKLHSLHFLFNKFTPERYYYLPFLLSRSLLICLVPVIFSEAASQVLVLSVILLAFSLLQMWWRPWRGDWVNIMDGTLTLSLELMLMAGSLAAGMTVDGNTISIIGTCILAVFFSLGIAFPVGFLFRLLFCRKKLYQCFLCHHKEDAAAQARLLKMLLQGKHGRRVFIDSDDLRDLGQLFDTVKVHVAQLVVYLTKETLRRPWCAGEVTTAIMGSAGSVDVIAVITPSFEGVDNFSAEDLPEYIDQSGVSLQQHDIFWEDVAVAYNRLLGQEFPKIKIPTNLLHRRDYDQLARGILKGKSFTFARDEKSAHQPVPSEEGAIVISADASSAEAVAASGIVTIKLQIILQALSEVKLVSLAECDADPFEFATIRCLKASRAILVLLSSGTLTSTAQVATLLQAVSLREQSASCHSCLIPCTLPGFTFPTEAYYDQVLPAIAPSPLDLGTMKTPQTLMKKFFRLIAVVIGTHASDQLLEVQVSEISNRLLNPNGASRKNLRGTASTTFMGQTSSQPLSMSSSASINAPSPSMSGPLSVAARVSQLMGGNFSSGNRSRINQSEESDPNNMTAATSSLAAAAAAAAATPRSPLQTNASAAKAVPSDYLRDQSTCESQSQLPKSPPLLFQDPAGESIGTVEALMLERRRSDTAQDTQDGSEAMSGASETIWDSASSVDMEVGGRGSRLFALI